MCERMRVRALPTAVFGRASEVAQLGDLVRAAVAGHGGAALVEGEPGIGKTTLLDVVAAEAERLGVRVLRGAATELAYRLPFAAIRSCLATSAQAGDQGVTRLAMLLEDGGRTLAAAGAADREFAVT